MTTSTSSQPHAGRWHRVKHWLRRHAIALLLVLLVLLLLFVFFAPNIIVTINAGQAGVLWKRFDGGTVTVSEDGSPFIGRIDTDDAGQARTVIEEVHEKEGLYTDRGFEVYPLSEGTHAIWPWDRVFIYNIRLQQITRNLDVLTADGLSVQAQIAVSWKPIEADLGKLHRDVGPDYVEVLLVPTVGACAREQIARHVPDALYSPTRFEIQEDIRNCVGKVMLSRFYPMQDRESYLIVEDVLIREVSLPPQVRAAIDDKVSQKHLAASYQHRLLRERMEADRKAIEAEGIRRFQETINSSISDGYLKWKGIEATLELAKSNNAKVVVIGAGGADGLPVILGGLENTPGTAMPSAPTQLPPTAAAGPPASQPEMFGPPAPATVPRGAAGVTDSQPETSPAG